MVRRTCTLMATAVVMATLVAPVTASAGVGSPSPPRRAAGTAHANMVVPAGTIKAVVVSSWDKCNPSFPFWNELNANWSSFGSIPISIDNSNPDLCGSTFTLAALEASGAKVVILNDPAGRGGAQQFTPDEIAALQQYASEGHNLIGTYLTFAYPHGGIDDSALAPLFGLNPGPRWRVSQQINPTYAMKRKAGPLRRNLPNPYTSSGYEYAQLPADRAWSSNELAGASIVGIKGNRTAAITLYNAGAYDAIYVANMITYNGGTDDQQFFYNALIYPSKG